MCIEKYFLATKSAQKVYCFFKMTNRKMRKIIVEDGWSKWQ